MRLPAAAACEHLQHAGVTRPTDWPGPFVPAAYVVLLLPAGKYTLEAPLILNRSRTVLRGEGSAATTLDIPKSALRRAVVVLGAGGSAA